MSLIVSEPFSDPKFLTQRKCHHTFPPISSQLTHANRRAQKPEIHLAANDTPKSTPLEAVRFVGDLNPESVLADLSERPNGSVRQSQVGVWIEASEEEGQDLSSTNEGENRSELPSSSSRTARRACIAPRHPHLLQFLDDIGAFTVLPALTQKSLIELYISYVHPFLPLVDLDSFLSSVERGEASDLLVLAICLTASKSSEAAQILRWDPEGPVVAARVFARRLYDGLHFAIITGQEIDPLINIQILGLLALHNDGPRGHENASMHLCQAIHHAHSLGLHIDSSRKFPRNGHTERMFWSLWCLDKFHACMAGRPVKIFDQDIGLARPMHADVNKDDVFHQCMALCELLAGAIHYYRPTTNQDTTGWEDGFPTLEEVTRSGSDLHNPDLGKSIRA
jgi:Fungal specific transcription factor domain